MDKKIRIKLKTRTDHETYDSYWHNLKGKGIDELVEILARKQLELAGKGDKYNSKAFDRCYRKAIGVGHQTRRRLIYEIMKAAEAEKLLKSINVAVKKVENANDSENGIVECPCCGSTHVNRRGTGTTSKSKWKYVCKNCGKWFLVPKHRSAKNTVKDAIVEIRTEDNHERENRESSLLREKELLEAENRAYLRALREIGRGMGSVK